MVFMLQGFVLSDSSSFAIPQPLKFSLTHRDTFQVLSQRHGSHREGQGEGDGAGRRKHVKGEWELARCAPPEIMNWLQMGPGSQKRRKRIVSTGSAGRAPNKTISDAAQSPGRALSH